MFCVQNFRESENNLMWRRSKIIDKTNIKSNTPSGHSRMIHSARQAKISCLASGNMKIPKHLFPHINHGISAEIY